MNVAAAMKIPNDQVESKKSKAKNNFKNRVVLMPVVECILNECYRAMSWRITVLLHYASNIFDKV